MGNYIESKLKNKRLKITRARKCVLAFLEKSQFPANARDIVLFLKENKIRTNQATVYRVLNTLTKSGLVEEIKFHKEDRVRFEAASKPHHHHVVCSNCGDMKDIDCCKVNLIESLTEKETGFKVKAHSLELYGLCSKCQ